jgi:hypothetical protein
MQKRLRQYEGRQVVAVLEEGSLAGTLTSAGRDELVLSSTYYLTNNQPSRPVDGVVVLPYTSIAWVQVAS